MERIEERQKDERGTKQKQIKRKKRDPNAPN